MKMSTLVLLAVSTAMVACAGSSSSSSDAKKAEEAGLCSQDAIDAYNLLNSSARSYRAQASAETLNGMDLGCRRLKAAIGGRTCLAKDLNSEETITVSYGTYDKLCSAVANALTKKSDRRKDD